MKLATLFVFSIQFHIITDNSNPMRVQTENGGKMTKITRGDPEDLHNVRSNIYHHFIRVDNPDSLIFLSGQLSRNVEGITVGLGDMAEQTRQAIRNMDTVLRAAGGTLEDIVAVTVYTTDMREFTNIVQARMEFFKKNLPTSTIVEVNHLSEPGLLIEIQAIAAL
jgi:2-iminobutanoate/2-iminopropanoate deaminase